MGRDDPPRPARGVSRAGWLHKLLVAALVSGVFALTYLDYVSYSHADAHLSLLVSQAIIEHGTIRLDAYAESAQPPLTSYPKEGPLIHHNGHLYYFFPIGSSVISVPFVWLFNRLGLDMAVSWQEYKAHDILSALICACVTLLLYGTCRCYLRPKASLVITAVSVLGSALVSTLGTALWSIDWALFFITLSLWLLARHDSGRMSFRRTDPKDDKSAAPRSSCLIAPYLLGFCLFAAFFCRASAATFILVALIYLLLKDKSALLKTGSVLFLLLSLFVAFSWHEFGSLLPSYYSMERFKAHTTPLWVVLYGQFFTPSRGLFIYSPFFALVLAGYFWALRHARHHTLLWLSLLWFALHFAVTARSTRWWGGHSFGPRIMAEALPALIVAAAILWREFTTQAQPWARRLVASSYIALGLWAIYVNSYQGLFNANTARWNGGLAPDIDWHPQYLFDWRYPQFLATREALCQRNLEALRSVAHNSNPPLGVYELGSEITHLSGLDDILTDERQSYILTLVSPAQWLKRLYQALFVPLDNHLFLMQVMSKPGPLAVNGYGNALFIGWSWKEPAWRWSECSTARIVFRLGEVDRTKRYVMEISAGSYFRQQVQVRLNGSELGTLTFPGPHYPPTTLALTFDGTLLRGKQLNEIEFHLPQATLPPDRADPRLLGLAFASLRILPE